MGLNNRPMMHVLWPLHHRRVVQGSMKATIRILRRNTDGSEAVEWNAATGGVSTGVTTLWTGPARVQHNKDWRARRRSGRGDMMIQHAFRVQIPFHYQDVALPFIDAEDVVQILESPYDPDLTRYTLYVRNSTVGSNPFNQNLLCDFDVTYTEGPEQVGPEFSEE